MTYHNWRNQGWILILPQIQERDVPQIKILEYKYTYNTYKINTNVQAQREFTT